MANVVIATNDSYRRRAIEVGTLPEDKVFVVRNGPPLVLSALSTAGPALVARARFIVGYVGTIGPQDGLDCLDARASATWSSTLGRRETCSPS